ncbi:carnitine o-acetyltransferase [Chrysochromulina tobinii]|jgi:hypothetical protein|uniref:Carnitine o-acetyltransferase n=1 Tax=Chrysochromulina tobinii TaxID=1460289 RepID=A0A0M0K7B9_9EUKA|nr:carnitine o-acetyltransferase [Chrysochromulina tobinii]|eukprot:KOO34715.1 carnitine o-acetyltransferase [Chrysochromulina sp. CCMP291]
MSALTSEALFPTQAELPPLPLPALSDTLARYLKAVKPLLTETEYTHTRAVVADFGRESGDGMALQTFLEEKADSERNWMEEWWEQLAYLRTRTTMAIFINWTGVMPEWGMPMDNVTAGALMLEGMMRMRSKIEAGKFEVEKLRGQPLDMHQMTRIFGMTRVPAEGADELVQVPDSKHIAVLRNGAVLIVRIYDGAGQPLPLPQLKALLHATLELADRSQLEDQSIEQGKIAKDGTVVGSRTDVSLLTALNRDVWAKEREALLADPLSGEALKLVESAICCVAFEREAPATKEEVARLCLGGSCRNKWFDKSFTSIIFENGRCGINAEHSPVDAMAMVSLFVNSLDDMRARLAKDRAACLAPPPPLSAAPPRLLEWRLGPRSLAAIEHASVEVRALADDCELCHLEFPHFGKGFIKRVNMHPDFFMQMALQLTMRKLHNLSCATYETGHTRAFFHGRTDVVRTLSCESVAFCDAMLDGTATDSAKVAALREACKVHGEQLQRVLTGQGIDRHLLGLYIAANLKGMDPLPSLFNDPAYKRAGGGGNYRLSTSNVGYTPLFGGFAPMTADGYGACYTMLETRMNIIITTWRSCPETSAAAFREMLSKVLIEMRALCTRVASAEAGAKVAKL